MHIIIIVIIIVVVVILCSVIFKRLSGGLYTIYTPSDDNRCASYGFTPNSKYSARELINDVTDMWINRGLSANQLIKKWNNVKNSHLNIMIQRLINEFENIRPTLIALSSKNNNKPPKIAVAPVITAIAEAFVACYIEKDLILKNFSASPNSGIGSSNMVIKCTATKLDEYKNEVSAPVRCVLRIYKRDDLCRDPENWDSHNSADVSRDDMFKGHENLIAGPIFSSSKISRIDSFNSGHTIFSPYWSLIPELIEFLDYAYASPSNGSIAAKKYIIDIRDVLELIHIHNYIYTDWKWINSMVTNDSNHDVVVSDLDFTSVNDISTSTISISYTHDIGNLLIEARKYADGVARGTISVSPRIVMNIYKNIDNYTAMRDAVITAMLLCNNSVMKRNKDVVSNTYFGLIHKSDIEIADINDKLNKHSNPMLHSVLDIILKEAINAKNRLTGITGLDKCKYANEEMTYCCLTYLAKAITSNISVNEFAKKVADIRYSIDNHGQRQPTPPPQRKAIPIVRPQQPKVLQKVADIVIPQQTNNGQIRHQMQVIVPQQTNNTVKPSMIRPQQPQRTMNHQPIAINDTKRELEHDLGSIKTLKNVQWFDTKSYARRLDNVLDDIKKDAEEQLSNIN